MRSTGKWIRWLGVEKLLVLSFLRRLLVIINENILAAKVSLQCRILDCKFAILKQINCYCTCGGKRFCFVFFKKVLIVRPWWQFNVDPVWIGGGVLVTNNWQGIHLFTFEQLTSVKLKRAKHFLWEPYIKGHYQVAKEKKSIWQSNHIPFYRNTIRRNWGDK